ncbi:TPA: hypothetical protein ACNH3O_005201 [Klebsiella pneumoniae]
MSRDENIQAVFDLKAGYTLGLADIEILKRVARMALAAMDGEPVVFTDERNLHHIAMGRETSLIWGKQNHEAGDIPLFRHAKPAPVVPKEKPIPNTLSMYAVDAVAAIAEVKGWNACRAAMLQASPVCTCPSGDGSLRWPCPVHPGNSPVIPGCDGAELLPSTGVVIEMNPANNKLYTPLSTGISITREMIIAGQAELESCIDRAFDSDVNGNSRYYMAIASDAPKRVFCAMLAAAQQEVKGE